MFSPTLPQIRGSRARALPDRALVNCQYSSATFSTGERKRRPHGDRKSCEMGLHLRQTFEAAILTQLHPRSQIDIYVQVSRQQPSAFRDLASVFLSPLPLLLPAALFITLL